MTSEVVTARLPPNDAELINYFIKSGEFKSKSDFFRFAVKHALAELIQQRLDSMVIRKEMRKKDLDELNKVIKKIRQDTWSKKYAKGLS